MIVINEIQVYELDGQEQNSLKFPTCRILSHWNYNDRVVFEIEGKKYTMIAEDLTKAIANAKNH